MIQEDENKNSSGDAVESPRPAQEESPYPKIIVAAFDDEPQILFAVKMQDNGRYVNVGRFPPHAPIGWPIKDAFDYDADSYARLVDAYEQGHRNALTILYNELRAKPRQFVDALQRASD